MCFGFLKERRLSTGFGFCLLVSLLLACSKQGNDESFEDYMLVRGVNLESNLVDLYVHTGETGVGKLVEAVVCSGDAELLVVGEKIRGELIESDGGILLQNVWPSDERAWQWIHQYAERLRKDTSLRGKNAYREIGELIPEFALFSSNGGLIKKDDLLGKIVVMNFIFTRCRNPDMCPAATRNMKAMQIAVEAKDLAEEVLFCSVSFDPNYDTPGILRTYGNEHGVSPANFHFLTGPENAIDNLRKQCGVLVKPDPEDILDHTMRMMLIDRSGRILHHTSGTYFEQSLFLEKLEEAVRGG